MIWEELTSHQLGEVDKNTPVIINIAAVEQHGKHLPLGTDKMIGGYFCNKIHEKLEDKVLVLPQVSIGYSRHHMDFPGTLSQNHTTILSQLEEIADSVFFHGFTKFIFFNSHGGNQGIGQVFIEKMGDKYPDGHFVMINWFRLAVEKLKELCKSGFGGAGHGGEFETSLMLRIAPHLVSKDHITERMNSKTFDWAEGDLFQGPEAAYYRPMKEMTTNGIYGDPRYASVEKGRQIEEIVLERFESIIQDIYQC
ncbi:creatininase family protein [Membranihabitans maritimus]|uniref:creatininase family protein n=1 Tax=Membranihabitans maritimus TaxID=2904244 RepID=UPI001F278273|nr:creatininase family protein [Membranihabitans maritimus]